MSYTGLKLQAAIDGQRFNVRAALMSMRFIIGTLLSFTLLAGGCTASSRTSESVRSRPANVVVILTDDAG